MEIMFGPLQVRNGSTSLTVHHSVYGSGTWEVNPKTMQLIGRPRREMEEEKAVEEYGPTPGGPLTVKFAADEGGSKTFGARYQLMWSTLDANRDRARTDTIPPPSMLRLLISK